MITAWQVVSEGDLGDAVQLRTLPEPPLGDRDVRVTVGAAALGFPDMLLAKGLYHDRPAFPFSLGAEAAGHVSAAGPRAGLPIGAPVIVVPGQVASGLLQDTLVVPAERTLPVPDGMPIIEAAAFAMTYQTSYIGLVRRCRLSEGETLLVLGASGGIGTAAIEIGHALGARVIAVTRGKEKAAYCASLGADAVVDLADEELVPRIKELTGGTGADVIFDPVGGAITDAARRCIALEGRLLIIGFASGDVPVVPVNHALLKNYSIVGYRTWPFRGDPEYRALVHGTLSEMYRRGELRPRVEQIGFDQVPAGLQRLADRQISGRLVVTFENAP
ncbi:NADPH:quinone oxidoreductase family protein [Aeromicrobium duanguangcaii]|uniref:NADPH:quinone oxidoreductase family protein n=1 Tax=Aeromicrobium duanguangcaii TaxID=2968086 RepID=A0ABY5KL48_9ACTN|nr:NADPH:quinone oxidoreductase family protein [Aeromicrobium duanguangcaii]MCD9153139.1 NADPH:quinone oxidoreductase family protein [Aeromicrobium duanguangcaii]UUI69760.1 NADPH:quinone oxidoreductase family protein [Aeromicrobium duanguangcaii]